MLAPLLPDLNSARTGRPSIPYARTLLAVGFALVAIAGAATVYIVLLTGQADRAVRNTFETREEAWRLLSDLDDAETGQRGFLLTANEQYLLPFYQGEKSSQARFADLAKRVSGEPEQADRLNILKSLAAEKLEELRHTIELAQQGQYKAAVDVVKSNRGKALMDRIRSEVDRFLKRELDLLTIRQNTEASLRRSLLVLACLSLVLAIALSGFLARAAHLAMNALRTRTTELEAETKLRRNTEDTLRQAQKIEAIGQLTGGIAHDFNNLLTVILGNLDTIGRRVANTGSGQSAAELGAILTKPLDQAVQGAKSAAQLTARLLAFSRRQPLQPTQLDLNRVISGISDLLRRTLGEKIGMEIITSAGLWPAYADANQVENALVNLCINARDAMPDGGRLTIEAGNTYLDEAYARQFSEVVPGQYVMLSVTDTGTGIPADMLDKVFDPFFTTKGVGEGSGLGLSMVYGFVKQSGGHIRIYSEPNIGTMVRIYLPRLIDAEQTAVAPAAKSDERAPAPRAMSNESILLVEDNEQVRDYARTVLQDLGYDVLEAGDTASALRVLDSGVRIDLLFTDVVLPDVSGRELADVAIQRRPSLPVLFSTGYTRNAIIHQGRLDPGVHLLSKPFTQQSLARKIRELLDARPADEPV
jgi:signal transduction histidine kinase/CheY-like chemotaxis protein